MQYLYYLFPLFDWSIFNITFSEISLLLITIVGFIKYRKIKVYKNKSYIYLIVLIIFTLVSCMLNINKDYFEMKEYILSFMRLLFLTISTAIIPWYISKDKKRILKVFENSIVILCVLGLFQLIIFKINGQTIELIPKQFNIRYGPNSMLTSGGNIRMTSVFAEPAHFTSCIILYYAILKLSKYKIKKITKVLIYITILLGLSVAGIALLITVEVLSILSLNNIIKLPIIIIIALSILIPVGSITPKENLWTKRVTSVINLEDQSTQVRLIGPFEYLKLSPIYGIGLGNTESFRDFYSSEFKYAYRTINNTYIAAYVSFGIVGLIAFIIFQKMVFNKNNKLMLFIFIFSWSSGYLLMTTLWPIYIYMISLGTDKK